MIFVRESLALFLQELLQFSFLPQLLVTFFKGNVFLDRWLQEKWLLSRFDLTRIG